MRVFNFEGAAIFGPGSEWLWFMAQFVALAITGFAINRQLHAQRFANELSLRKALDDEWLSEPMVRFRLAALMDIARGRQELTISMIKVGDMLNELAYQQNHGALESTIIWDEARANIEVWWFGMAAPRITKVREFNPSRWREWEQLAVAMAERDRRTGTGIDLSPESLFGPQIQQSIVWLIDSLRLMQEMRSGVIPEWPGPLAASEPS